jgi:hypothetical protein
MKYKILKAVMLQITLLFLCFQSNIFGEKFIILSVITKISQFFLIPIGFIFGFYLTYLVMIKKDLFAKNIILIWWFYVITLTMCSIFFPFIKEATEVFNTDRGDTLPILPLWQQNLGIYLNLLICYIPLSFLIITNPRKIL